LAGRPLLQTALPTGNLVDLLSNFCVTGVTTNPTIFAAALGGSAFYQAQLEELINLGADVDHAIRALTTEDVRTACDLLAETYAATAGHGHRREPGRIGDYVVTAPLILGHELSGRIVAVGEDVPQTRIANGSPSSPRRTAESAVNAAPGVTTSVQTWSSTPPCQSTAHSRSIA
jgi:hypothetical protein